MKASYFAAVLLTALAWITTLPAQAQGITRVAFQKSEFPSTRSPKVKIPECRAGDVLIAIFTAEGAATFDGKSQGDWNKFGVDTPDKLHTQTAAVYWRRASDGESGGVEVWENLTKSAETGRVTVIAYRGCKESGWPVVEWSIAGMGSATTHQTKSIITPTKGCMFVGAFAVGPGLDANGKKIKTADITSGERLLAQEGPAFLWGKLPKPAAVTAIGIVLAPK